MTDQPPPTDQTPPNIPAPEDLRDLGFGSQVSLRSQRRFLNRNGTFNVRRRGLPPLRSLSLYHLLLTISWPRFYLLVVFLFLVINLTFAGAYLLCGPGALLGSATGAASGEAGRCHFADAFFFSVQTLCTIGYGALQPRGLAANLVVTAEALLSLLGFALVTGLTFARFSRPVARILFSRQAIVAPYHGMTAFEFRIINTIASQIVELRARVIFSRLGARQGRTIRVFDELPLERPSVTFFPLQWTVVHPIDERSPLQGLTGHDLEALDAEFIVLLTGIEETFNQTVHTRSSYKYHEVVFGARFADMFEASLDGTIGVDLRKLHDIVAAELPPVITHDLS